MQGVRVQKADIFFLLQMDFRQGKSADAKLKNRQTKVKCAVHDAGMAVRAAFVGVAQVGMSVKLDNTKGSVLFFQGA